MAAKDPREAQRLDAILKGVRPYDLGHSYLTMTHLASEDIHATQKMGQHSDSRMTNRYTLAAVDPRLKGSGGPPRTDVAAVEIGTPVMFSSVCRTPHLPTEDDVNAGQ
jgi:hypothetical protein